MLRKSGVLAFVAAVAAGVGLPASAGGQSLLSAWAPNSDVDSVVAAGNAIYVGGSFNRLIRRSGPGVVVDPADGALLSGWPEISGGSVYVAVPDGSGGWFIGGDFTEAGPVAVSGLTHVLADGSVDHWAPTAGAVTALQVSAGAIYVGGYRSGVRYSQGGNYVAAFDRRTSRTLWSRQVGPGGEEFGVRALALAHGTLYVGGEFWTIGGSTRQALAALDPSRGRVLRWAARIRQAPCYADDCTPPSVSGLAFAGGLLVVCGDFARVAKAQIAGVVALDPITAEIAERFPRVDGEIDTMAVGRTTIYLGGNFTHVGPAARSGLAALDMSGTLLPWKPRPPRGVEPGPLPPWTYSLAVSDGAVYAVGDYGGPFEVAFDAHDGKQLSWHPQSPNDSVLALAASAGGVFIGGSFTGARGVTRNGLAALDSATGEPSAWNPAPPDTAIGLKALASDGKTLYGGGSFRQLAGQPRSGLAAFDVATGNLTGWNPNVSGQGNLAAVRALALSGTTVFAGGDFSTVGGQPRSGLAAIDTTSGQVLPWRADVTGNGGQVLALAVSGATLYVGGQFDAINGTPAHDLAAVDTTTGAVLWGAGEDLLGAGPDALGAWVDALAVSGSTLFLGGNVGSGCLRALDATTGRPIPWPAGVRPPRNSIAIDPCVASLVVAGPLLYVGGSFDTIGGHVRHNLAAVDLTTGAIAGWNPAATGVPFLQDHAEVLTIAVRRSNGLRRR
jgi:hypothetical protein